MAFYKTITAVQLWTKAGNKAGTTRIGVIVETDGFRIIKYRPCVLVLSDNYKDKYAELSGLVVYIPDEPELPPVEPPAEPFDWSQVEVTVTYKGISQRFKADV